MLRLAIIDKLQVLAMRRPHALVVVAQVLDALLNEQLKFLDERLNGTQREKPRPRSRPRRGRIEHRHSRGR